MSNRNFAQYLEKESSWTLTENMANALGKTGSSMLDLFGVVGAMRSRPKDVVGLFEKAFAEDKLLATKLSFYARNVRGGLMERDVPKEMWNWLAVNEPEILMKNMEFIPEFGRWDDLYVLVGTPCEDSMWEFVNETFNRDIEAMRKGEKVTLLAKWLKSVNTSSAESRRLGRLTAKKLSLSQRDYRKTLALLRKYIDVTEIKMSAGEWNEINYEAVPSKAMANNRKAFSRHDGDRFGEFIGAVQKGEAKIHSGTLYPYDIFEKMGLTYGYGWGESDGGMRFNSWDAVLEEQWKALPNYVDDGENILVVADTSGSMSGRPMCTSVGLAVYFAERNSGQFHNKFITFSSRPSFVTITGSTLAEKVKNVPSIVDNTNLQAVFELVLDTAVRNSVPQEDMPRAIVIISDMEIDSADNSRGQTFHSAMSDKFKNAGYELPNMVYWNVASRHDVFHASADEHGVQLASGQSPSVFKGIVKGIGMTPYDAMVEVLNDPQYDCIKI